MARRGTAKDRSIRQEEFIARKLGGRRSPSSGAAATDQGDVRTPDYLIECKVRGTHDPDKAAPKSVSISMRDWHKIADEALSEGRIPLMALRVIDPDSVLADRDGFIDIVAISLNDFLVMENQ